MSVKDIAKLGKLLAQFLAVFACCFARTRGRALLAVYVRGLLSGVQRKNAEAIALDHRRARRRGLRGAQPYRLLSPRDLRATRGSLHRARCR